MQVLDQAVRDLTQASPGASPGARSGASRARIMIVDDEPLNIRVARKYLELAGYDDFITTSEPQEALKLAEREIPDLVLLDIMMPQISGLDVLRAMRASPVLEFTPIVILTASDSLETKRTAYQLGATDFLTKPIEAIDLTVRVRNALVVKAHHDQLRDYTRTLSEQVQERTAELALTRLEVIYCLARAAEFRDNETGQHVVRVGRYAGIIARRLGLDEEFVELLEHAAPLHDVGKIGIPDAVLLKPGRLTPEEFAIMQNHCGLGKNICEQPNQREVDVYRQHTDIGARIVGGTRSPLLALAGRIAITHHEKWDGSGYPLALAGEAIPLEGRITAVADVFDALCSRRPYKPAFPLDKCLSIMEAERGKHFDPRVLDAFFSAKDEIVAVQIELADVDLTGR